MCGIIGVSGIPDAARLTYLGLYALQHRGQESAGHRRRSTGTGRPGRIAAWAWCRENFDETILAGLPGDVAVGHTRYSTTGSTVLANAQPCNVNTRCGPLAIAHNGNLINAAAIKRELVEQGAIFTTSSDTEVLVHLIARSEADTVEDQIRDALEQVDGAYSLVITRRADHVCGGRQPRASGRWCIGRLGNGIVVASETCALDLVGRLDDCELQPGRVRPDRGRPGHPAAPPGPPAGEPLRLRAGVLRPARQHASSASRWTGCGGSWAASSPASSRRPAARWSSACPTAPTPWRSASPRSPASSWSTG